MIFCLRNKKNNLLIVLLIIAFLVSFCSSAFSSSFRKGFPAPTFTLKTIDGETFDLADYKEKHKLLILYFCNNENEDSVCGKKISFIILLDSQEEVSNLYNIEVLPTTIFLAKNLVVKRIYPGLISKQQNLMFQYLSYFLEAKEKGASKKATKEDDDCNGGTCDPPPGY
jgi:peroxiredoxin